MRWLPGKRFALVLFALLAGVLPVRADFYQGKQLVVLVNFAQGGPIDAEGRLLARHLGRVLAGAPSVIIHNMAGDNGAAAANWLAQSAAPDGLIVGCFSGIASMRALDEPVLSRSVARLSFVAAGVGVGVAYARTDIGGGIAKPKDLLDKRDFWVGGLRPDSDRDLRLRLQLDLLGIRHNYQSGFPGITEARQAFQRGEIQVLLEPLRAYRAVILPALVDPGAAIPLWLDPIDDGETFQRSPEADDLPALTFTDILAQARGKLPDSEQFEAWRLVNQMGTVFQRVMVMAPGTPPEAVEALRKAMAKLASDAAFRDDALTSIKFVPSYLTDTKSAALFARVSDPAPNVQALLKRYVQSVAPDAGARPPSSSGEPARK
jgi:hypothetical protein